MGQVEDEGKLLLNYAFLLSSLRWRLVVDDPPPFLLSPPPSSHQLSLRRWLINRLLFMKIYNTAT